MRIELIESPSERLVSLDYVKKHMKVDTAAYDDHILALIIAAESYLDGQDGVVGRCFRPQRWKLLLPGFTNCIKLPLPPTIAVTLIEYYDTDEVLQTLATSYYRVISGGDWGSSQIIPAESTTYPDTEDRPDAVHISFTAGYEDNQSPTDEAVPGNIKLAAAILVQTWYDEAGADVPEVVKTLIAPLRTTFV